MAKMDVSISMVARILLAVGVVTVVVTVAVVAAPTEEKEVATPAEEKKGRAASLPAEHRNPSAVTPHPIEDIMDAVLNSETVSAVDEAAARVTNAFGDIIDDLGDFVVQRVKDLPGTIKQVSDTVSRAVDEGREQVVIVVKGVRTRMQNHTSGAVPSVVKTVDRMANATTSSKTAASFQDLHQRMAVSLSRIFGSLFINMDDIDSAVADGIRRITAGDRQSPAHKDSPQPPSQQHNEVEVLS